MTIDQLLFGLLAAALLMNWPVAAILVRAAVQRPRIRALTVHAVLSVVIATVLTLYVGYWFQAVPVEAVRVALLLIALYPLWFLWIYLTGRFRDGGT